MKIKKSITGENIPCEIYIDPFLLKSLESLHKYRSKDFDAVGLFVGEEGAGKTTLALQLALLLDHNFSNSHICFNAAGFEDCINRLPDGSVIVWDEADDTGAGWASDMMFMLKKTFKRIRKHNYIIFLVTPTFHDLNKYFAIHRTRFLVDVYAKETTRGFLRFFKRDNKKKLYIHGKKEMNMFAARPDYRGRFTNYPPLFPVDMDLYEEEKDLATLQALEKASKNTKDVRRDITLNVKAYFDREQLPYSSKSLAELIGVDKSTINRYIREGSA